MLSTNENRSYYVKFVKHPKDIYTAFSIGVKNPNGGYKNYSCFALEKIDVKDGDKIRITKIISVDQEEFNGKPQFKATIEFEVVEQSEKQDYDPIEDAYEQQQEYEEQGGLDIDDSDLPF